MNFKAIVTFSQGNGSFYSEHVRYFEGETREKVVENANKFRNLINSKWDIFILEVGNPADLDEYGSESVSNRE